LNLQGFEYIQKIEKYKSKATGPNPRAAQLHSADVARLLYGAHGPLHSADAAHYSGCGPRRVARLGTVRTAAQHMCTVALGHVFAGDDFTVAEGGQLHARLGQRCGDTTLTGNVGWGRRRGMDGVDDEAWTALGHARLGGDLRGKTEER
jgi:hypothetical protein